MTTLTVRDALLGGLIARGMIPRTWHVRYGPPDVLRMIAPLLPYDFTTLGGPPCNGKLRVEKDFSWICSRTEKHSGRHAAGDGGRIWAVWY